MTRLPLNPLRWAYALFSLGLLALLMLLGALMLLIIPRLEWRRALTRNLARLWLWLTCIDVTVRHLDRLPTGACVLVANHASYLDGLLMMAMLPPRFAFVIKSEAATMPVVGLLLRRIGSEFVDRQSRAGRHRAAKRIMQKAEQGHALVFFPEGTFDHEIGIKRFHVGAFVAAVRGSTPLIPAAIHGARRVLPPHALSPRPGRILVEILQPLAPVAYGNSAESLRDAARTAILEQVGEPDLSHSYAGGNKSEPRD
jgi:1-acyl-sn-glycerol-3-phosphate acyltransferase